MKHQKSWMHTGKNIPTPKNPTKQRVNSGQLCKIPECGYPAHCRGWCPMHYQRNRLYGDPLFITEELARKGKGMSRSQGKMLKPHQVAYVQAHGPIPICKCEAGELLHVHHKDGNHYNDDPENLVVLTPSEHHRLHRTWDGCQVEGCNSK